MSGYRINELADGGRAPRFSATGYLGEGVSIDEVVRVLGDVGVSSDRLHFLLGDAGVEALESGGSRLSRLLEDGIREGPVAALRNGKTIVAVVGVQGDDVAVVQAAMEASGIVRRRYFGRWSNNAYR